jgi:hypothetical protein
LLFIKSKPKQAASFWPKTSDLRLAFSLYIRKEKASLKCSQFLEMFKNKKAKLEMGFQ